MPETVFDAHYFCFNLDTTAVHAPIMTQQGEPWVAKDITSGILLQHLSRKQYYYCVLMNWTEYTVVPGTLRWVLDNPYLFEEISARHNHFINNNNQDIVYNVQN